MHDLGLGEYVALFAENDVDWDVLSELSEQDLKELGLSLGHRKRLLKAIGEHAQDVAPPVGTVEVSGTKIRPAVHAPDEAERRQLTVMFCDLVGSTELSGRLDPEDLRDVMRRYQDAVAGAVTRYDGYVAKFLGDGVLAYFGWPQAREDQAERAVRAGLACVDAVHDLKLGGGVALQSRVGIATGRVVIGDIIGEAASQSEAVVGETPNLAARLQTVAEPDQVVIEATTRRLIANAFELVDLGRQRLKGVQEPAPAWHVEAERAVESRFEAAHPGALTPFVGREHELGLLLERWERAKAGEGQIVLLSGEAGVGKSRILQTLWERISQEQHYRLRYQCSPFHINSAFHPVIRQLERAAGFQPGDPPETKLDKLETLLAQSAEDVRADAPIFALLLALPGADRYGPLDLTPTRMKLETLQAFARHLLALAHQKPVLLVFEDAHWIDPTSRELLDQTLGSIVAAPVLMLITHRPGFSTEWTGHAHVTALTLSRLSRSQGVEMVRAAGGFDLPDETISRIAEHADGVPLFVEELTRSVIELGAYAKDADIPTTLQASLMERLDRLGEAKDIAQIGAAIGRDFSYTLLSGVSSTTEPEFGNSLSRLVASGLVYCQGSPPEANFTFKHALVQDAAYESLLTRKRRELHARIAEVLEASVEPDPTILAHHCSAAGLAEKAARYYLESGNRLLRASGLSAGDFRCRTLSKRSKWSQ